VLPAAWKIVCVLWGVGPAMLVGVILRFAKAPSELFPTDKATPPFFEVPRSSTARLGAAAPFTYTSTHPAASTMRAWNQPLGSGGGSIGLSNWPVHSARIFCHVRIG